MDLSLTANQMCFLLNLLRNKIIKMICKSSISACACTVDDSLQRRGWQCLIDPQGAFGFRHFIWKDNVRLWGEVLNVKVIHSLQCQGHHHKKSFLLELSLSERRQHQNKTLLIQNWTTVPDLLSPSTHLEGGDFMPSTKMDTPINQQGKSFPFMCFCGIYHKIALIWAKLRIGLIFFGYLQQHSCFH